MPGERAQCWHLFLCAAMVDIFFLTEGVREKPRCYNFSSFCKIEELSPAYSAAKSR